MTIIININVMSMLTFDKFPCDEDRFVGDAVFR